MNKQYDLEQMTVRLSNELDKTRFLHTMGVRYTAAALAMSYGSDLEAAQTAGLLHDCAKCIPNKEKIFLCEENHIPISRFERSNPFLLHSKLGAFFAKEKYEVKDEDILSAITYHTTGKPQMTQLEKIIFIADYIEPRRDKAQHLKKIRQIAFRDLDECMYEILKDTLAYLEKGPNEIDTTTEEAYSYYESIHQSKQERV